MKAFLLRAPRSGAFTLAVLFTTPLARASAQRSSSDAPIAADTTTAQITVMAGRTDLTLHLRTDDRSSSGRQARRLSDPAAYTFLCAVPCAVELPFGYASLAVARDGGPPIPVRRDARITRGARYRAQYASRRGARLAGRVLLGVLATSAVALTVAGVTTAGNGGGPNVPLYASGVGLFGLGVILVPVLMTTPDKARIAPVGFRF